MNYKKVLMICFGVSFLAGRQIRFAPEPTESATFGVSANAEETLNSKRLDIWVKINDENFIDSSENLVNDVLDAIVKNTLPEVDLNYQESGLPEILAVRISQVDKEGNYHAVFEKNYSRSETDEIYKRM